MSTPLSTRIHTWYTKLTRPFVAYREKGLRAFVGENWGKIIAVVFWVAIIVLFLIYKSRTGMTNTKILEDIYFFLHSHSFGVIIFMVFFLIRPVIFFPSTGLIFIAGLLYGPVVGFIIAYISVGISAQLSYLIGRGMVRVQSVSKMDIPKIPEIQLSNHRSNFWDATMTMIIARLLFLHFDITNYVAGVKKVYWSGYSVGTAIGIVPDVLIAILAGASFASHRQDDTINLGNLHPRGNLLIISIIIFIISLIAAKILRDYQKRQKAKVA